MRIAVVVLYLLGCVLMGVACDWLYEAQGEKLPRPLRGALVAMWPAFAFALLDVLTWDAACWAWKRLRRSVTP